MEINFDMNSLLNDRIGSGYKNSADRIYWSNYILFI